MKLADLILLYDSQISERDTAPDAEVIVRGPLWEAWVREAKVETQRGESITEHYARTRRPAKKSRGDK